MLILNIWKIVSTLLIHNISLGDKNNINFMLNQLNNELHKAFSSLAVYNLKGIKLASLNNSNNWFDLGHNISNEDIIKNSIHGNAFQDKHCMAFTYF